MRLLMIHVDYFKCQLTQKGRSSLVESPEPRVTEVGEALVVLASAEKADERDPARVAELAARQVQDIARKVKAGTIVVHSFAHLFAELAQPAVAVAVLDATRDNLLAQGYVVHRPPFGWFNTLEIKAKGHPLSRVARLVSLD
ncbi:MAG: threonyl-tRNA synthetase editing domain-containing protein [Chloroflexota bacterium]